jgi:hypothetical protein
LSDLPKPNKFQSVSFFIVLMGSTCLTACFASIWSTTPDGFKQLLDGNIQMKIKASAIEKYFTHWGYEIAKNGDLNTALQMTTYQPKSGCKVTHFFNNQQEVVRYIYNSSPELCVYQRSNYLLQ